MTDPPTRTIPWPRIFVEGAVIVASILLALAADAWWDERQEREEEQEILAGLESDFTANLSELEANLRRHEAMMDRLFQLLAMSEPDAAAVPYDSLPSFNLGLVNLSTFAPQDGTLDGLIASGNLDLIRDIGLRDRLVEWKRVVEDSREEAEDFRSAGVRVIRRLSALGGPWGVQREGGAGLRGMQRLPTLDLTRVVADPELMTLLREKRFMIIYYYNALEQIEEAAEGMLTLVQQSLN